VNQADWLLIECADRLWAGKGEADATTSGGGTFGAFTAWCVDIATYLQLSSLYTITDTPFTGNVFSSTRLSNIEALFETGFSTLDLTKNAQSAGFQLALWEVLYENSSFNLTNGNFGATSGNASAIAVGQALLAGLGGPITQSYKLTFLESTGAVNGTTTSITASIWSLWLLCRCQRRVDVDGRSGRAWRDAPPSQSRLKRFARETKGATKDETLRKIPKRPDCQKRAA
jgi:hypothetical protein